MQQTDIADTLSQLEPAEVMQRYRAGLISRRDVGKLLRALGLTGMAA